jgi:serine protease
MSHPHNVHKCTFILLLLASLFFSYNGILYAQEDPTAQPYNLFLPLVTDANESASTETDQVMQEAPDASTAYAAETDQIIVYYKKSTDVAASQVAARLDRLAQAAGMELTYVRDFAENGQIVKLSSRLPLTDVQAIAEQLGGVSDVAYAEPDKIMRHQLEPNDPRYDEQWHYFTPTAGSYGANLPQAWDVTTGSANVVIAVLDTGMLFNHPDLVGRTVAGYDFIADTSVSNDGDGRDADASDPGDWCSGDSSSWHGTHVAGTIGAASNNSLGVAGINWISKIQPVRVLGACGGYDSDIADAIRWSAGLTVSGTPANATPAKVINLSLGGTGSCGTTMQNAINAATNAGTVVVVAAGNDNANAANYSPSSCNNVITVAATGPTGNRAYYSNYGATVEISAPGGDTSSGAANGVLSTLNNGTTTPGSHSYAFYQGTSMATPHIAGIVSLMFSVNPNLTPAQVLTFLQSTVTNFPSGSSCTTALCGAGIVNAGAAVIAVDGGLIPPGNLNASPTSDTQLNLTWTDASTNETGFKIERCQGANCSNFVQITTVGANVTTYSNTGLTANTAYKYRVRAYQGGNNSAYSNTATATTLGANCSLYNSTNVPVTIFDNSTVESMLTIPENLTLTDVNVANLTIYHTYDDDLVTSLVSPAGTVINLFSNVGGSGDNFLSTRLDDAAGTLITSGAAPFTGSFRPSGSLSSLNGQSSNGTWRLRVQDTATQDTGSIVSWALELCATPAVPAPPTNLMAVGASQTQIDLSWTDNSNNETTFQIRRTPLSAISWSTIANVSANTTTYVDTDPGLVCGETYRYLVRAHNSAGYSSNSNSATAQLSCSSQVIFADGFESGNLAAWSGANNPGKMSVTAGAALVDSAGLRMTLDSNTNLFLTDNSPAAETRYRMRFYLDPNSMAMAQKDSFITFYGYHNNTTSVLRIDLRYFNGNYQVRTGLLLDSSTWNFTPFYSISDASHTIEVDWQAASAPGANNGGLTLFIDGLMKPPLTSRDNDTWRIDRARFGAIGVDTGTRGTFYLDDFVSQRQSYIGPATVVAAAADSNTTVDQAGMEAPAIFEAESVALEPERATVLTGNLDGPIVTVTTGLWGVHSDGSRVVHTATLTTLEDNTLPAGYERVGHAFDLQFLAADGALITALPAAYSVTLQYDQLDETMSLQLWNSAQEIWEVVPTTVDLESHTLQATLQQSGRLALMQSAAEPSAAE